ncbi:MAG: translation elongation factor Ts [Betaproteobacteria bacterium]|nr:translation elongation factor Ts [Betaproteobacteria bacterium]
MNAVSAEMVRTLRDATGAGMMECKKALTESGGDFTRAVEFLRIKSGVKAGKVSGRTAGEGRLAFAESGGAAVLVEIKCETDFVARGEDFAAFCQKAAALFAGGGADALAAAVAGNYQFSDESESERARRALVMKVGENVSFGRVRTLPAKNAARYIHTGDKIGALAEISGGDATLARDICMHIAAMRPEYLSMEEVPEAEMKKERAVVAAQTAESGKPPEVVKKMITGRLQKHFAERVLFMQPFVKDGGKTVGKILSENGASVLTFHWIVVGGGGV